MTAIGKMDSPVDWNRLERELCNLAKLGPTVKAWGRQLFLVRPGLYCTVSSKWFSRTSRRTTLSGGATIGAKAAGVAVDFAQGVAESHVENQGDQPQQQSTGCGDQCNQDEPK